jgi:hypothetical protein
MNERALEDALQAENKELKEKIKKLELSKFIYPKANGGLQCTEA